jgi:ribonuclease P protein component
VDRNRVKRQLREAYRLNKHLLHSKENDKGMDIAFIWLTDQHKPSQLVATKMISLLGKIAQSEI